MGTTERYRFPARGLHWLVAFAIPFQIYLGWASEWASEWKPLLRLHYQWGVILAALMAIRLIWRIACGSPVSSSSEHRWQRRLATFIHWMLYVLLLLLPASGYIIWVWMKAPMDVFGLFDVPRLFTPPQEDKTGRAIAWYVHYWSGWALIALALLHISAALWHQFVRRDGLISRRML